MVSIFNVLEKKTPVFYFRLSSLPPTPLEPLVMAGGIKLVPCFLPVASPLEVKVSTLDRMCGGYKVVAVKFSGWGLRCICARTFRPACDDSSWVYFVQNGEIWSEMLCCRLNEGWDWRPKTEKGNRLLSVLFLLLYIIIFFFSFKEGVYWRLYSKLGPLCTLTRVQHTSGESMPWYSDIIFFLTWDQLILKTRFSFLSGFETPRPSELTRNVI